MSKPNVLFVDDEASVLSGLRRSFHDRSTSWNLLFANSGREALDLCLNTHVDVIVTDVRMPEMDGTELLEIVARKYPTMFRIILSGECDEGALHRALDVSHRFFSKPCDRNVLLTKICQALSLRHILESNDLRRIVTPQKSASTSQTTLLKLNHELAGNDGFQQRLDEIISADPALTARLIQVANSSHFSAAREIRTVRHAISMIGIDLLRALALENSLFAELQHADRWQKHISACTDHSIKVAQLARRLAKKSGADAATLEDVFTAGMLHNIGHWTLAAAVDEAYFNMFSLQQAGAVPIQILEKATFGADHCQVGAYMLGLWGMRNCVVHAALAHHDQRLLTDQLLDPAIFVWASGRLLDNCETEKLSLPAILEAGGGQLWTEWQRERDSFIQDGNHAA